MALVAAFALTAGSAGGQSGPSLAQNEAKVHAQIENAITLETYARSQLAADNETGATRALGESVDELKAAQGIIEQLYPPSWMKPDSSLNLDRDALNIS